MIIDSLGSQAKTNIKNERAEFSVSADKAKKFLHIAVRNLYSNPVLASIVEVSQNAHDEHVRRGIEKKPFEVTLPTTWVPTFSVRDFGAGIPHDYMLNGYTQALESTKDSDSDMSGGWGLGRLALLSLASTYNITTYISGKERNYSVFESENGIEILMTHERATKEVDGTLISAPVPTEKISQFRDEANRAFRYYHVKPIIKGDAQFKIDEPTFLLKGNNWAIENGERTTSAVCGIYHYTIDSKNVPNLTEVQAKLLGNVGLVMFFGASDLAPMANRQGLYYNDKTVIAIKKRLNEVEAAITVETQKKFDSCKTYFEAKLLWGKLFCGNSVGRINSILSFSKAISWNGILVEHNRIEDLHKITHKVGNYDVPAINCTTFNWGWSRGGHRPKHIHQNRAFDISDTHILFINDLAGGRGFINRAKSFMRELNAKQHNHAIRVSVLTFASDAIKAEFYKKYNLNELDFKKISTVTVVPTSREGSSIARAKTKVFEWNGKAEWCKKDYGSCWNISEIDLEEEEEGIYVAIERYAPLGFGSLQQFCNLVGELKAAKYIDENTKIYGFRSNSEEYTDIQKNKDWISIFDLKAKFLKEYSIPANEIQLLVDASEYANKAYNSLFRNCFYYQDSFNRIKDIKNKELREYCEKLKFMTEQYNSKDKQSFENRHKAFLSLGGSINNDGVKPTYDLTKESSTLKSIFPILSIVNLGKFEDLIVLDNFLSNQK